MPARTQREREAAQRKEKLDRMREQIDDGSLVVRTMTDEERARYRPRPRAEAPVGRTRRRRRLPPRPLPPAPRPR